MRWILYLLIFIATERFCYFQTGSFSLSKMLYEQSPPSPTHASSSIELTEPLRFLGAGKQFYAFETADGKYVVKFMKWSRRRPLDWLEKIPFSKKYRETHSKRAPFILNSCHLALKNLPEETQLVIPKPQETFTLIDKLGIFHTVPSASTHFYVQRRATPFADYYREHQCDTRELLSSFIHTVALQCRQRVRNLDPMIGRNYGVADEKVILLDIGSFKYSPELCNKALVQQEIVLELLPLRAFLQKQSPKDVTLFDILLKEELK